MTTLQQLTSSQSSPEIPINENAETLSAAAIYGKRHPVTTGLTWGYYGGLYAGNTVTDGTVALTNNADNYVVVLRSSGVVSTSTTSVNSLNTAYAKLYKLTTLSGVVTVAVDQRMDANGVLMSGAGVGGAGTVTHTAGALTAGALMVGNAAADTNVLASLGTTTTVLHGNAAGLPTFGSVSLTADVIGILPIANIATGAPTGSKFVRDDGVLAVPAGSGSVTSVAASVPAFLSVAGSPITTNGTLAITYSGTALPVANGGTGATSLTAYAPVFGGTTSTGAVQSGTVGSAGQVLTSNGAGAVPTFQAAGSGFIGGTLTSALNEAPPVTIASGTSVAIGAAAANSISISGASPIISFDTIASGAVRRLVFQGGTTLTHNATSLILPSGANITAAAGDVAWMESIGSGNWRCIGYQKANGTPLVSGNLVNFTEGVNAIAPNVAVPAVQLLAANAAANVDVVFSPKGIGSLLAQSPDNAATGGNKRGANAVDWQTLRTVAASVAGGIGSAILGGNDNSISTGRTYSVICGGDGNSHISGTRSFIGSGSNNVNSGTNSGILSGFNCSISSNYSSSGGRSANVSADYGVAFGFTVSADGIGSSARGQYATARGITGADAWGSGSQAGTAGQTQIRRFSLSARTTNNTPTILTTDRGAPDTTNQIILPSGSMFRVRGQIVSRKSTVDVAGWTFTALARNVAGTLTMLGSVVTADSYNDASASAYTITIDADATNKAMKFTVVGGAADQVDWQVEVVSAEITA